MYQKKILSHKKLEQSISCNKPSCDIQPSIRTNVYLFPEDYSPKNIYFFSDSDDTRCSSDSDDEFEFNQHNHVLDDDNNSIHNSDNSIHSNSDSDNDEDDQSCHRYNVRREARRPPKLYERLCSAFLTTIFNIIMCMLYSHVCYIPFFLFYIFIRRDSVFFVMLYYHVSFCTFLSVLSYSSGDENFFKQGGGVTIWKSCNYNILLIYTVSNRFIF